MSEKRPRAGDRRARLSYRDGQLLAARDLRDEAARDQALRVMHVRHQHETWGIALGFTVKVTPDHTAVVVQPGYAVDVLGQDLVLGTALRLPLPRSNATAPFVLVARAVAEPPCPSPDDSARWRPGFTWQRPPDVQPGLVVPLASALVGQGHVQGALDDGVRVYARKLLRPRIAAGATDVSATDWAAWTEGGQDALGLEIAIDTTDAGFLSQPRYFARLQPPPQTAAAPTAAAGWVASPSADGFVFRVAATAPPLGLEIDPKQARVAGWTVAWMGIEPWTGAEPLFVGAALALGGTALQALLEAEVLGGD